MCNECDFLGDYGFFAGVQFKQQGEVLFKQERKYCTAIFLSDAQWKEVDSKLEKIAEYGSPKLDCAVVGDTFMALAVRENSYDLCHWFLDRNINPLIKNEAGADIIGVLSEQYAAMSLRLSDMHDEKEASTRKVLVPTEEKEFSERENKTLMEIHGMIEFIDYLSNYLKKKLIVIEGDRDIMKQCIMRKVSVSFEIRESAALEEPVKANIEVNHRIIY